MKKILLLALLMMGTMLLTACGSDNAQKPVADTKTAVSASEKSSAPKQQPAGTGNDIAPGIIVTPLAIDEFNGPRGDFYKNMFAKCPAGRPGTADEVADVAELLMSERAQFITGATFLVDGGATASFYYGPLQP